jgi:membrane protein DedA with SNARE-associated domain
MASTSATTAAAPSLDYATIGVVLVIVVVVAAILAYFVGRRARKAS